MRSENRDNPTVQDNLARYSRIGSGRPVEKRIGETVVRDRHKQVAIDDEFSYSIGQFREFRFNWLCAMNQWSMK